MYVPCMRLRGLTSLLALSAALTLGACGTDPAETPADTATADDVATDSGTTDAGGTDAATGDTGAGTDTVTGTDAGGDAGTDAGTDTGTADTGPSCPGAAGCDCKEDKDCTDGLCAMGADGKSACAKPCTEAKDCDAATPVCGEVGGKSYCVDANVALCSPCSANADCAAPGAKDAACVDRGGAGSFCATACKADADCADGYACKDSKDVDGKDTKQCVPKDDKACGCSGWATAKKLETSCFAEGKPGCTGKRTCGDKGLSACDAAAAKAETCSGLDEDCDGTPDNGDLCDDKNPCTKDSCDGKNGCKNEADDAAKCDDGDKCTDKDACKGGKCGGAAVVCDDANPCTDDSCDKAKGCVALPNKATCDDANACTEKDACAVSLCQGVTKTCDDKNPCTDDSCDPKKGCQTLPNKVACDDGDACTEKDTCDKGACTGAVKDCDDKNPCTTEVCDPKKGCQSLNNLQACDDGDKCTVSDRCKDGKCAKGNPKCVDGKLCTDDKCNPTTGACTYPAGNEGAKCDDGKSCTTDDACAKGLCAGKAKACDDKNLCTMDACDEKKGCVAAPIVECNDDDACTSDASKCDPVKGCLHTPKPKCTSDAPTAPYEAHFRCGSPTSKAWKLENDQAGVVWAVDATPGLPKPVSQDCALNFNNGTNFTCPSGKSKVGGKATSPVIDLAGVDSPQLTFKYSGTWELGSWDTFDVRAFEAGQTSSTLLASLNNSSTSSWKTASYSLSKFAGKKVQIQFHFYTKDCISNSGTGAFIDQLKIADSSCVATGCNDGNPCTTDTCDTKTGKCSFVGKAGGPCDDGNLCTEGDACTDKGECKSGAAKVGKACDDGVHCTDKDACDDKAACKGSPAVGKTCDDGNLCTDKDACDDKAACKGSAATGKACDDGNLCTLKDACTAAGTCAGSAKCDDGNTCTNDSCASVSGFCTFTANTSACDDGDSCTGGDKCKDGICFTGTKTDCDDGDACTTDACEAKTGLCKHTAVAGCVNACKTDMDCADGDACTTNTCDVKTGKCASAPAKDGLSCGNAGTCSKGICAPIKPGDGWAVAIDSHAYAYNTCALLLNGTVSCWGDNAQGQLGDGTTTDSGKPVAVKGLKDIQQIAVGYYHACALTKAGTVKCWGDNNYGQLGDGKKVDQKEPVDVVGVKDATAISTGNYHTCALAKDQTVWCWGNNYDGQLGIGKTSAPVLMATQVKGLGQVTQIVAGYFTTCALRTDRSKWCWGANNYYQASADAGVTTADQPLPTRDGRMTDLVSLAHGYAAFCGVTKTGQQRCVGYNTEGAFGTGKTHTTNNKLAHVATQVSGAVHISGGYRHAAVVTSAGKAWASGDNFYGQLGDGTKVDKLEHVKMPMLSNVVQAAAGRYHTCLLRADGSVWCTGSNTNGALGGGSVSSAASSTTLKRVADAACQTDQSCQDDNACTKQQCSLADGLCKVTIQADKFCDDGDLCTINGKCDKDGVCKETKKVCDDGNPCTIVETCDGGKCSVQENLDCNDDNPCTTDACDVKTGVCTNTKIAGCVIKCSDDSGCDDKTGCTTDKCVKGVCEFTPTNEGQICGGGQSCSKGECAPIQITGWAKAIAMHPYGRHACALKTDGTVACWGYNNNGQLGNGSKTQSSKPVAVSNVKDAVAIGAGYYHACAVTKDGKVWCWGDNFYGQLGNGSTTDSTSPVEVKNLSGAKALSMSAYGTCALTHTGKVFCWGDNGDGEAGQKKTTSKVLTAGDTGLSNVVKLSGGYAYQCALKKDGTTWCWGYNFYGNAHHTTSTTDIESPKLADKMPKAQAIGTAYNTTCVVDLKGDVYCMGYNATYGVLGIGKTSPSDSEDKVWKAVKVDGVVDIAGGYHHMLALKGNGTLTTWGYNNNGQLGQGTKTNQPTPTPIGMPAGVVQAVGGYYASCALLKTGSVWCVGDAYYGQLGNGSTSDKLQWQRVIDNACKVDADCNAGSGCFANTCDAKTGACTVVVKKDAVCDDGDACSVDDKCDATGLCQAKPKDCDDGDACTLQPVCEKGTCKHLSNVACDDKNPCTTDKCDSKTGACTSTPIAGCKWTCKGDADCDDGKPCTVDKCGSVSGVCEQTPGNDGAVCDEAKVCGKGTCSPMTQGWAVQLAGQAYNRHLCALHPDSTASCWGYNNNGQVGDGTKTNRNVPTKVSGLSDASLLTVGYYHSCAMKKSGRVTCWGDNAQGQMGDGTTTDSTKPKEVAGLNEVVALSTGRYHNCAVKKDGTLWCWGDNGYYQSGNSTSTTDIKKPTQVPGITGAVGVECGGYHTCVLFNGGAVSCWGYNTYRQLSSSTDTYQKTPLAIAKLPPVAKMGHGDYTALYLTKDGVAWTRGHNSYGAAGTGNTTSKNELSPAKIAPKGLLDAKVGYYHSLWLDGSGQAWSVGYNTYGGLGDNTTSHKSAALVKMTNGADVVQVAPTYHGSCVLKKDGSVWCTGYNSYGANGSGSTGSSSAKKVLTKVKLPAP